ncbi:KAP family P-loop NTPase fold protein [Halocola ammonii]
MKIKNQELEIPVEQPFQYCKLSREPFAKVLTDIVNTYADGFVLAINNEWGTGKTTFVKMWQQHLKNEGFQTVYFNAWENDFDNNPLVAVMSELESLAQKENKRNFKSVIEKGSVLVKNVAPALFKAIANKYIDAEEITTAIENATKASTEILEEEIKEYSSKKKTIVDFRKELEKFVKNPENEKPLIFIVDELDRCRPSYSVEVLEQIKHFFSVPGIVFVLSIDKNHLSSAVKGFYGSEQINSNEYLRRFIDLEYSIPKPSATQFIEYLFEYYEFNEFFKSKDRSRFSEVRDDPRHFISMAQYLIEKSVVPLRKQERIFALTRLVLSSFKANEYTLSHVLFLLVFLKISRNDLYQAIDKKEITVQRLSDSISEVLLSDTRVSPILNLGYIEALLLWLYNNNLEHQVRSALVIHNQDRTLSTPINSRLNDTNGSLAKHFVHFESERFGHLKLDFLLNKINLTEPIST